jgi:hypothetical protein
LIFLSNLNTNFHFVYDKTNIDKAAKRQSDRDNFLRLLVDVQTLSEAEFFVGTFTSNVGRFSYELMQAGIRKLDNSFRVKSLDNHYYVNYFNTITYKVIQDHFPANKDEIELKVGDIVLFRIKENTNYLVESANLWNGFMLGKNTRTNQIGKIPSFKVVEFYTKVKINY